MTFLSHLEPIKSSRFLQVDVAIMTAEAQPLGSNALTLVSALGAFVALTLLTLVAFTGYLSFRVYKLGKKVFDPKKQAQTEEQRAQQNEEVEELDMDARKQAQKQH